MESSFHVFGNLFGCFKVHFVHGVFVELAIVGGVIATDLGPSFVDAASMVRLQMFAVGMDEQVPRFVLDENSRAVVEKIPANEIEILMGARCFDRHRKIATALGCAISTQDLARRNFFSFWFAAIDRLGRKELDWG